MSRGRNSNQSAFRRGNRPLAWYIDSKISKVLDQAETQERDSTLSPAPQRRKNSFDSESSLNSNGRQTGNDADERKRRANKARAGRQRSQNSQNEDLDRSDPIPIDQQSVGSDQQASPLQQHILGMTAQATQEKGRENYWYYDANSDGYFYEFCGSRGWRKRNPKLHGNLPANVPNKAVEENTSVRQTVEKVYVPIPVPVFTNGSKFFPQAGTSPNIKYYDPSSDGYVFETASVDGWKKRNTNSATSMHSMLGQSPRVEPSSLVSFPPLGRDLTSRELEELILNKMKGVHSNTDKNSPPFSSVVSRGLKNNIGMAPQRPSEPEYPSSSSTVSSSVASDDATPPPPNVGKENQCQQLFAQTKEPMVGSFEEPYEFYWSDSEKPDSAQPTEQAASSVSSVDDFNPLNAYFNEMSMNKQPEKPNLRVQRPSSLKILNPPVNGADKRLPNFNIDRFIADLPGNDNFMNSMSTIYAPFGTDSPRTPFNQYTFTKESPMFTPMVPKENAWARFNAYKQEEFLKDKASAESSIDRGLLDLEKIWN